MRLQAIRPFSTIPMISEKMKARSQTKPTTYPFAQTFPAWKRLQAHV